MVSSFCGMGVLMEMKVAIMAGDKHKLEMEVWGFGSKSFSCLGRRLGKDLSFGGTLVE